MPRPDNAHSSLLIAWVATVAWVPWAVYLASIFLDVAFGSWLEGALPAALGLAIGFVAWKRPAGWEKWVLLGALVQALVLAYTLGMVLARPIHLEADCGVCSMWKVRSGMIQTYIANGQLAKGLHVLWNDGILPLAIVATLAAAVFAVFRKDPGP